MEVMGWQKFMTVKPFVMRKLAFLLLDFICPNKLMVSLLGGFIWNDDLSSDREPLKLTPKRGVDDDERQIYFFNEMAIEKVHACSL